MKLDQVEQVLEIARTGTFSQAARNLYMAQPNLSASIKQLEDELHCTIFVRTPNGVILTEEGKFIVEQMAGLQSKYNILKEYASGRKPSFLPLTVAYQNLNRMIPYFVEITKKYMDSPINFAFLDCHSIDDIVHKVASCEADIGIFGMMSPYVRATVAHISSHHIEYHRLACNKVCAVVGPENEYYTRKTPLTVDDLKNQTVITFGNEAQNPSGAVLNSANHFIPCAGRITIGNGSLFYEMVSNTSGLGLVTSHSSKIYQNGKWPNLQFLEITDYPYQTECGWIKLERMPLTSIAEELIESIQHIF
jgi:DNA-binding transcriptional LysR family regulator